MATDVDRMDHKAFFTGKSAFVGMSTLEKLDVTQDNIEDWVNRALQPRKPGAGNLEGLSIEVFGSEENLFESVDKIMVVVGIPPGFVSELPISTIIKRKVLGKFGEEATTIDYELFSYGSLNALEITIFCRHSRYRSSQVLAHFLDYYFLWYREQSSELEYLTSDDPVEVKDTYIEEVRHIIGNELGIDLDSESRKSETYKEFFDYLIDKKLTPLG